MKYSALFSLLLLLLSCNKKELDTPNLASDKAILNFSISGVGATINETNKTITLTTSEKDLTNLAPLIQISDKATVSPKSGESKNFTNSVKYTVTAEDESTQDYAVTVSPTPTQNINSGISYEGTTTGTKTYNLLIIRGEFSDKKIDLTNDEWNTIWSDKLPILQKYLTQYGYGQININAKTSSVIEFSEKNADFFRLHDLNIKFKDAYKTLSATSTTDDLSTLENADIVIFSYPRIAHNVLGGAWGTNGLMWIPSKNLFEGGIIHEFGHALGMPHSQGIEGVTFGDNTKPHKLVTDKITEGYDGLHMIGSDGQDRTGFFAPFPIPYMFDVGLLPSKHQKTITTNGTFRIFESELQELPTDDKTLLLDVSVDGILYHITFSPKMRERYMNFQSDEGFENGIIIHKRYRRNQIALIDFTPNSYRKDRFTTAAEHNNRLFQDFRDGALQIGKTFNVPKSDFSPSSVIIEPVSRGMENNIKYIDVKVSGY